ncbi:hypothetical protein PHYBLDRAFT_149919 [Phycomyces blakesleeanus NRRL 1555(-)]|uniref:CHCH domain-containing protein n=1 Tax=Phycomyces blakesleeanus (strain ATCC 8743b / DSM 1359 / FGSC 10004 / NBRC 33097 / NRRL 1555) TaxID=763407 RepID=A0A167KUF5_PHYB8|nr:hypothetical protein PHYBLDRAFT_149919 [Phycomyces blakesleeanus NRRL 1555(-)]OAD68916.1 hypothetical protein PHYBLDRAFT_149919 [Phycomyces blakesleeanus NRRL 1555(-)]|eukprot:XP_018286956.1 hypothetical protein PHYBLDRAFT_149919 [Phycomyces blakesleeanus NRRL 1555(-)]
MPSKKESCDSTPLQQCLLANNNDQTKCRKEWDDFQRKCREKQKKESNKPCETCKLPEAQ